MGNDCSERKLSVSLDRDINGKLKEYVSLGWPTLILPKEILTALEKLQDLRALL